MAYFGYQHFENDDGIEAATSVKAHIVGAIEELTAHPPLDFIAIDRAMGFIETFRVLTEQCTTSPPDNMTGATVQRWRRAILHSVVHHAERANDADHAAAVAKRRAAIEATFAKLAVFEQDWRDSRHWELMLLPSAGGALQSDPEARIRCLGCDEAELDVKRSTADGIVRCVLRCSRCGFGTTLEWSEVDTTFGWPE